MTSTPPKQSDQSTASDSSEMVAIGQRFNKKVTALRLFAEQLGPIADSTDEEQRGDQVISLLRLLGVSVPDEPMTIAARREFVRGIHINISTEPISQQSESVPTSNQLPITESLTAKLVTFVETARRRTPSHGHTLRTSALMLAVSLLDALFADLLQLYFVKYPSSLDGEEHKISFSEICSLGSIDAARELVLHRKIESILRRSCRKQIEYFTARLKIDLSDLVPYLSILDETVQRRHVWVHNGGRVNKLYLANVDEKYSKQFAEGETLPVDAQYLRRAIDRVNLAGVVISQQCWRKWLPSETRFADSALADNVFDTLCDKRYVAAQYLGKYACRVVASSDESRRNTILNYAQAFRWAGKPERAKSIVLEHDWSSCNMRYRIAAMVLSDEVSEAIKILPLAIAAGELSVHHLREWPIFQSFREDARVKVIIDEQSRNKEQPNSD
ncbi:MAG TPA: hypothetical protein VG797_02450 [Phycisphaerales bacterium]|nr:hypothetical protein [Phycisphaerales bacterium]